MKGTPTPSIDDNTSIESIASVTKSFVGRHPYLALVILGLLVSLPLLIFGLPIMGDDTLYHGLYYRNFAEQLWAGEIYPRWLHKINAGLGGPSMFYYPPAAYYITSIFWPLPLSPLYQLGLGSALAIILAACAARLWISQISSSSVATAVAALYILLPYPVAHDVYSRGAIAELFTFVWMPLILFFVVKISRGQRMAPIGLAVSYALLCTTHLPTTLMFSLIPVLYSFHLGKGADRQKTVGLTVGSMAFGVGLAAAYLLPALTYQDYAFINEMKEGPFYFGGYMIGWKLDIFGNMKYFWMLLILGTACICSYLMSVVGLRGNTRREAHFWAIIFAGSLFMMLEASRSIWDAIPVLQKVQFPYRFNTVASVASLPLFAFCATLIRRPVKWTSVLAIVIIGVFSVTLVWRMANVEYEAMFKPPEWWRPGQAERMDKIGLDWHAFWPKTVPDGIYDIDKQMEKIPRDGAPQARIENGAGSVNVTRWASRDVRLDVDSPAEANVQVAQFYYPGWRARLADTGAELPIRPSDDLGIINITVPPGSHKVEIFLEKLRPEFIGRLISALCILLIIGFCAVSFYFPGFAKVRPRQSDSR